MFALWMIIHKSLMHLSTFHWQVQLVNHKWFVAHGFPFQTNLEWWFHYIIDKNSTRKVVEKFIIMLMGWIWIKSENLGFMSFIVWPQLPWILIKIIKKHFFLLRISSSISCGWRWIMLWLMAHVSGKVIKFFFYPGF